MTATAEAPVSEEERFMTLVADICSADAGLTPLGGGILAALHLGVCSDTRSFSRILGIAHALVLREVADLSSRDVLRVASRNERTQRTEIALTDKGERLVSAASGRSA
jgi:DNA-binding HxlR family transcriptional regulator